MGCKVENYNVAINEFLAILSNIGDIIVDGGSKEYLTKAKQEQEEAQGEF